MAFFFMKERQLLLFMMRVALIKKDEENDANIHTMGLGLGQNDLAVRKYFFPFLTLIISSRELFTLTVALSPHSLA